MRLFLPLLYIASAWAQQPRITNAQFESHALTGNLETEVRNLMDRSSGPAWVAYAVPAIPGQRNRCCWNSGQCCESCSLERTASNATRTGSAASGPIRLEGANSILVLMRIEDRAIGRIAVHSSDCELDAGGLPFHLIAGVQSAASANYLAALAPAHKEAVMAIAQHGDPAADVVLERLVGPSQPAKLLENAVFWLGSARGSRGLEVLKKLAESDPSDHVRDKVMFAFSVSKEPAAIALLIASARTDPSPKVRGQALFWLAQKAGQRETSAITRALDEDPDTHVKKQAVFALSQLPSEQGIPLLIQVARTNKNADVRKQAMFWLGQTNDPRALQFFEQTLIK